MCYAGLRCGLSHKGWDIIDNSSGRPDIPLYHLRTLPPYITKNASPKARKSQDGFVFVEQNDLTTAGLVLEGSECNRAIGESSRGGGQLAGGTVVAEAFFHTQRTLSRPRGTLVSRAKTVASSRQLHWECREPCSRGSCSTRRRRCCSSSQVSLGGRPERGRSRKPWGPSSAKRCTHLRRGELPKWTAPQRP